LTAQEGVAADSAEIEFLTEEELDTGPTPEGRTDEAEARRREVAQLNVRGWWALTFEIGRIDDQVQGEVARIEAWAKRKKASLEAQLTRVEASLRAIGEAHLATDPRLKSIDVPSGRISFTADRPKLKLTDKDQALAALQAAGLGQYVRKTVVPETTTLSVDATPLKKALVIPDRKLGHGAEQLLAVCVEATGEVLEGFGWQVSPELAVSVKPPVVAVEGEEPSA
jgi:phage host-nuclease inhibitor protein Gam